MQSDKLHTYLSFDPDSPLPRYRQLYQRVRDAIDSELLHPGDRLPATRWLADELGLARGTVTAAYRLLEAEGRVMARGAAGVVVLSSARVVRSSAPSSPRPSIPFDIGAAVAPMSFQMGIPALDTFPRKVWARLAAKAGRATLPRYLVKESSFGSPGLRTAIAAYLQLARGIRCSPEQVFVTSGYRDSLTRIARTLLEPGSSVWTEDPGFPPTRELLIALGMRTVPVPVDDHGMKVIRGMALGPHARAAVVTPAHQSPLTVSLALPRRTALLDWAMKARAWIIEDDYDGEFRYAGKPLPALASLDGQARVIYCSTFSKVMFPGIRLAYIIVPPSLIERFEDDCAMFTSGQPLLTQSIVADFIQEGHFVRHIQRMRRLYAERSDLLRSALLKVGEDLFEIHRHAGGMHLVVGTGRVNDLVLADHLQQQGMLPVPLSPWYTVAPPRNGLLFSFANIADELQADELAKVVAKAMWRATQG
jgi:GntR family transcriptional regulator/MocR family aminotransferase